ncbi:S-adenosylmethionine uptake transporter [Loktanella atrilutea]|uniref:S-adenosylmethionine uptake transporter n=1 Tax=Loktanella atrilutea TaxID=366533 RepID=A0A1M4ZTB3_LOKAT|nr:DMT family transporter [Loktanella atrilutea]SHF20826.1 S-adenosylmethionine uptake transporter [Loktanella atrilutea]
MAQISDNMRGAALMTGAMVTFTINDSFTKSLGDVLPLWQLIFLRGIGVTVCLAIMARLMGQLRFDMPRQDWGIMWLRAAAEIGGAYFFITALFNMPIANVSAIMQVLPLSVSLAGALFMAEALGWRRLVAILVGFGGVMLIVRPGGADFNIYSLYALAAVACVTLRDLIVRKLSRSVPSMMVSLVAALAVTIFAGLASLTEEWQAMTFAQATHLGGATVFVIFGYIFSVAAMRVGEIGFVAPFRYASLLTAIVLGLVFFAEFPSALTLSGAGIVVATGIFTLFRERKLALRRRVVPDRIR